MLRFLGCRLTLRPLSIACGCDLTFYSLDSVARHLLAWFLLVVPCVSMSGMRISCVVSCCSVRVVLLCAIGCFRGSCLILLVITLHMALCSVMIVGLTLWFPNCAISLDMFLVINLCVNPRLRRVVLGMRCVTMGRLSSMMFVIFVVVGLMLWSIVRLMTVNLCLLCVVIVVLMRVVAMMLLALW